MKKEDIIESAKKNHTIEYDYSLVRDANKMDKIDVICPIHGIFHPRLSRFLLGSNCPLCSGKVKKDKESFVLSAQKKHNNFYSYDKFEYINSHTKSIITCPIHGDFEQSPTNHLNGNGCPKCHKDRLKNIFSSNSEEFITKSKKIHNDFYSYEKVNYVNNTTKVIITCPIHGDFEQEPHNHLQGKGCPICNISHLEKSVSNSLSINKIEYEQQKRFDWLGKQSLDFYLPEYNIAIECQGKQHFGKGYSLIGDNFTNIFENDVKKYDLCLKHNIKLVYLANIENKNDIIQNFYNDKTVLFSTNDILNYLGINQIKNEIIELLTSYQIEFNEHDDKIEINNLIIYPLSDLTSFYNNKLNKNYFNKLSIQADKENKRIIWIKPFEWFDMNKKEILKSFILSACGKIINRIYARDCYVKVINNKDVKSFLNRTSMYGYRSSSVVLGLFTKKNIGTVLKDTMVMCYTFGKAFYGKGKYDIEVLRASSELYTQVIGGASKLWKYFLNNFDIITINNKKIKWNTCCYYVDFDHNNGKSMQHLGFEFSHYTDAGFHNVYEGGVKKINRIPSKHKQFSEMLKNGIINVVYNAGTKVYLYTKKET